MRAEKFKKDFKAFLEDYWEVILLKINIYCMPNDLDRSNK